MGREGRTDVQSRPDKVHPTVGISLGVSAIVVALVGVWVSSEVMMIAGGALGLAATLVLPRNALPAAALWILVLLPVGYMDIGRAVGRYFTPSVLIIGVWVFRLAFAQRMVPLLRLPVRGWFIVLPIVSLLLISTLLSELHIGWSLAWMAVFVMCVIAPALLSQISEDDLWPTVRLTFAAIGLFLGALALVDFLFQFNPWTSLYRYDVSMRTWAVFRTQTSLGHPLMTSMVGCVAFAVSVFPHGKGRQWPFWVCAAGALLAVVLSVSRTGIPALFMAIIIGALSMLAGSTRSELREKARITSMLIAAGLAALVVASPLLSARNESSGAITSAAYRQLLLDRAAELVSDRPLLGSGPGTSSLVYVEEYGGVLENSYVQLMISIGLPAALLFLAGIGAVVLTAMRRSRAGAAAGLVAFFVSVAGFNALDSNPAVMALIAPLIYCALVPTGGTKRDNSARYGITSVDSRHPKTASFGIGVPR